MVETYCSFCGRKVAHFGVRVSLGYYAGQYSCADIRVTAKEAGAVRRILESCCRPVHMPVMLRMYVHNPELSYMLSRFLKFGRYEKRCAFRRFLWSMETSQVLVMPVAVTDVILNFLIPL